VKHIEKRNEPASFTRWKGQANEDWSPTFEDLRGNEKADVHRSLVEEQGFICCYCEGRIEMNGASSNIEHLMPRSRFPEVELDYNNLLASCLGGDRNSPSEHCNGKKGNWYEPTMVSPLQVDCSTYFFFTRDGQILPSDDPDKRDAAEETIAHLNLNHERLIRRREEFLNGTFDKFSENDDELLSEAEDEDFTDEQLQAIAETYAQFDQNGRLEPFCTAILDVIRQKLAPIRE
jgi:uncharacterized protein (TIGR02646 family)